MGRLSIRLQCADDDTCLRIMTEIGMSCFNALRVNQIEGTFGCYNIDNGMNDIRAIREDNIIHFHARYKHDQSRLEKRILDYLNEAETPGIKIITSPPPKV